MQNPSDIALMHAITYLTVVETLFGTEEIELDTAKNKLWKLIKMMSLWKLPKILISTFT